MVAVQVAENDPADLGGVFARTLHRNQRRRTAVDKNRIGHPGEKEASLEASAASEGVSRTKKLKPYGVHRVSLRGLTGALTKLARLKTATPSSNQRMFFNSLVGWRISKL
jgi:hypothetical protein